MQGYGLNRQRRRVFNRAHRHVGPSLLSLVLLVFSLSACTVGGYDDSAFTGADAAEDAQESNRGEHSDDGLDAAGDDQGAEGTSSEGEGDDEATGDGLDDGSDVDEDEGSGEGDEEDVSEGEGDDELTDVDDDEEDGLQEFDVADPPDVEDADDVDEEDDADDPRDIIQQLDAIFELDDIDRELVEFERSE